jgi:hypothetical protein
VSAMVRRKGKLKERVSSQTEYQPSEMGYEATDEDLTATGGLGPILDLFIDSPVFSEFCQSLPARVSNNSYDTEAYALVLLSGFIVGFEQLPELARTDW